MHRHANIPFQNGTVIGKQIDIHIVVLMNYFGAQFSYEDSYIQLLFKLSHQGFFGSFSILNFTAWKFPAAGKALFGRTSCD